MKGLEQTVLECAPGTTTARATGEAEEVLFVVAGHGELCLDGERHTLEPDTGINLAPGQEYELRNETSDPMRMVSVRVRDRAPRGEQGGDGRVVVRRLADQEAQDATTDRMFRIVADPSTGLGAATHFVGYVPTVRAPDHYHTYDEVIYVLEGEGAFHAGGTSRPIGAGSCIELPARTIHCLENTGPDVMRLVAVFRPPGSPAASATRSSPIPASTSPPARSTSCATRRPIRCVW